MAEQICRFMELIRLQKLEKMPGAAETLDWSKAPVALHQHHLEPEVVADTLGIVLKDRTTWCRSKNRWLKSSSD